MSRTLVGRRASGWSPVQGGLAPGISAANSNTRISPAVLTRFDGSGALESQPTSPNSLDNLGLNSERMRAMMVQRLRLQGITDERVLDAMLVVPRHRFVDEGLASRAYDDAALPIGHGQTISQPWIVARMISVVCEHRQPRRVLEVGAGCGYQAAVLAQLALEVYAIERIGALYETTHVNLQRLGVPRIKLLHGDGMGGWPTRAPFDAIVVAAAGVDVPQALLMQLAPGGRLIAPAGESQQKLILVERTATAVWERTELEAVRFVPLRAGIQS